MDMFDDFSIFGLNPPIGYSEFNFSDNYFDVLDDQVDDLPLYDF